MVNHSKILLLILLCFNQIQAEVIKGVVTDSLTTLPIPNVNISIVNTKYGTQSDSTGEFVLNLNSEKKYILKFQRIGYAVFEEQLILKTGKVYFLNIRLKEQPITIKEILVEGEKWSSTTESALLDHREILPQQIVRSLGSLEDPVKTIQNFTGVISRHDFTSQLFIRGSSPDQNALVLDGVMLYNPYRFHFLSIGGLSIFNSDMIESMDLTLGGFSTAYGNRMSGLLSIHSLDGGKDWRHKINLNIHSVGYNVQGPITNKITTIFSARRTYYDWIINQFANDGVIYPFFQDFHGKVTVSLLPTITLRVYGLYGEEGSKLTNVEEFRGEFMSRAYNGLFYISADGVLNQNFHYRLITAYQSNRDTVESFGSHESYNYSRFSLDYRELSTKVQGDWELNNDKIISTGLQYCSIDKIFYAYSPYWQSYFPENANANLDYERWSAFVESHIWQTTNFEYKLGFRWDYYGLNNQTVESPRMSFRWIFNPSWTFSGNWGIFHQLVDPMNNGKKISSSKDISEQLINLSAQKMRCFSLEIMLQVNQNLLAKLAGYNKKFSNLPMIINPGYYKDDEKTVSDGKGESSGIELKLAYSNSDIKTWLGYTYSVSRKSRNYHSGWGPTQYDQPHWLVGGLNYSITSTWLWQTVMKIGSGFPTYKNIGWIKGMNNSFTYMVSRQFNRRPYFRWDMRITYRTKNLDTYFEVINVLDIKNFDHNIAYHYKENEQTNLEIKSLYMLPRLPTFGIIYRF